MKTAIKKAKKRIRKAIKKDLTKKIDDSRYVDLAPVDDVDNGEEYLNAMEWALSNQRIKNIALTGPYGSGKSSIIQTYIKKHPELDYVSVSMATFDNDSDGEKTDDVVERKIEEGILKQLFYKVKYYDIPQSRYRKLHRTGTLVPFFVSLIFIIVAYVFCYTFIPDFTMEVRDLFSVACNKASLSNRTIIIIPYLVLVFVSLLMAFLYRFFISKVNLKEFKISNNATVQAKDSDKESIFNKNLEEILYFFEEMDYDVVFFEDLDRFKKSEIFVKLRELNNLLNNDDSIGHSVKFVYAVRDDIFTERDRTKFFEFIIPIVPVMNSTNSGETMLSFINGQGEAKRCNISQNYIDDVSPFIGDMRVLRNIFNEFLVYNTTLGKSQSLHLQEQAIMSLIIYKNLFPEDFSKLQNEEGLIKDAFNQKQVCIKELSERLEEKINEESVMIENVNNDYLKSRKEIVYAMLPEFTNNKGFPRSLVINGNTIKTTELLSDAFDYENFAKQVEESNRIQCQYQPWENNMSNNEYLNNPKEVISPLIDRIIHMETLKGENLGKVQNTISDWKQQLHDIKGYSLKRLIEEYGAKDVLPENVIQNDLLVFMLRKGYIDEQYPNYINYFKGNSITTSDMNYILSIKNRVSLDFGYQLVDCEKITHRLQTHEFEQREILNFALLNYLLENEKGNEERLAAVMMCLSNISEEKWDFIDAFFDMTQYTGRFLLNLSKQFSGLWDYISESPILTYDRKIMYFKTLILNVPVSTIETLNSNSKIIDFFIKHEDILKRLNDVSLEQIEEIISALDIHFDSLDIAEVNNDLVEFIFDNCYYTLNDKMLKQVVSFKNSVLLSEYDIRNYSTIKKTAYTNLIEYVHSNWEEYVKKFILKDSNTQETEEAVLEIINLTVQNKELCNRIICHLKFAVADIGDCLKNVEVSNNDKKEIWDYVLDEGKLIATWKNIYTYWKMFKFDQGLIRYINKAYDGFCESNESELTTDFIKSVLLQNGISNEAYEKITDCVHLDRFTIDSNSISSDHMEILIKRHFFEFNIENYNAIKREYPDKFVHFVLLNQDEFLSYIGNIKLDGKQFESLVISDDAKVNLKEALIDKYGKVYMSDTIAKLLEREYLKISKEIFWLAWDYCGDKKALLLLQREMLNCDDFERAFRDIPEYKGFLDRTRHNVELQKNDESLCLAKRLERIHYITSFRESFVTSIITSGGKTRTAKRPVIVCVVKNIK